MAVYKVLQDIEAEDKLVGPLTLKQFIFAIITLGFMFVAFIFARINIALGLPWLLPILLFGFLAAPLNRDQPNDVWIAARIRFFIKPRQRIWDQSGMTDLVTITAPKKELLRSTSGLDQHEVRSRLHALANTMDSRGWAAKNVNVNLYAQPDYLMGEQSDRLIGIQDIAQEVPNNDVQAADDIMDPMSNMVAQRFQTALQQQQTTRLSGLKQQISGPATAAPVAPTDYGFILNQAQAEPGFATFGAQVIAPGARQTDDDSLPDIKKDEFQTEEDFLAAKHAQAQSETAHLHHTQTVKGSAPSDTIKELSKSGSELSVAAVASIAKHAEDKAILQDNEVISLR